MAKNIKYYILISVFIVLAVDFGDREKTLFVNGGVRVKVVEHADVDLDPSKEVDPEQSSEVDGEPLSQQVDKRRSAAKPKAVNKVTDPDKVVPHDDEVGQEKPGLNKRREIPGHPVDDNGKYVGPFDPDCSDTIVLTPMKKEVDIEFEHKLLKPGGTTCHWDVIGTEDCIPVVNCKKFHLIDGNGDKDDPCAEEYLEITDGSYGFQRFCGKDGPDDVTSGRKFRDLFITLKLAAQKISRSLRCTVTCSPGKVHGKPLDENSEPNVNEECNCGRKPNSEKIVGVEESKRGEFPWIAALVTSGTRKPFCGASIINNRMILTAAHCFKGPNIKAKNINILINAHKLNFTDSKVAGGQTGGKALWTAEQLLEKDKKDNSYRFTVDKYYIHPLYVRQTNDFDVALIKLDKPIDFKTIKSVTPACLPHANHYGENKEGANAVVTGWGLDSSAATATQPVLQKLDVGVFTNDECKEFYGARYTRRMLCAGYREGGKDSCKGDSGGPLISEKNKQTWEQIGIVSFGEGCADKHQPGVYINTRQVSQWIRYISNMEEAVWCHGD